MEYIVPVGILLVGAGLLSWDLQRPNPADVQYKKVLKGARKHGDPDYWRNSVGQQKDGAAQAREYRRNGGRVEDFDPKLTPALLHPGLARDANGQLIKPTDAIDCKIRCAELPPDRGVVKGKGRRKA